MSMLVFGGCTLPDMEPTKGWVVDVLLFPTGLFSHSMFGYDGDGDGRISPRKKKKHEVGMEVSKLLFCLRVRKCKKNMK